MSIAIQHAGDPWFRPCETCRERGIVDVGDGPYRAQDWCPDCDGNREIAIDLSPLATLAHNLAIAAGLCRAFDLGWDQGRLAPHYVIEANIASREDHDTGDEEPRVRVRMLEGRWIEV